MCGIVAYLGKRNIKEVLLNGLSRLEYRGYDSAGIAIAQNGIEVIKSVGKVAELEKKIINRQFTAHAGIAHTRWATHGIPSERNAHPHVSNSGKLALVHNGIIENYAFLKQNLQDKGYQFYSDTDTEVLVNFIDFQLQATKLPLDQILPEILTHIDGAFAFVCLHEDFPNTLFASRRGSPMMIGIGSDEFIIASDASPILDYTQKIYYVEENQVIALENNQIHSLADNIYLNPDDIKITKLSFEAHTKGDFEHYMLKEIYEQPETILDSLRGRITPDLQDVKLASLEDNQQKLLQTLRYYFVACGTSYHAGLIGKYIIEETLQKFSNVEVASEFRYRNPYIHPGDTFLFISQSGETADTLQALDLVKSKGVNTFGICNVPGSTLAREVNMGAFTKAGTEVGVASTKAFTAQLSVIYLFTLWLNKLNNNTDLNIGKKLQALSKIPSQVKDILDNQKLNCQNVAQQFSDTKGFLYIGRGVQYAIALEGALKMKEITYIQAEAYPAGELKHGPIALIDENMPIVIIAPKDKYRSKLISNIQEIKARKGKIIAVITEGDSEITDMADYVIEIPETDEFLYPFLTVIPLQLLSYYMGIIRGCDVDKPRNLAKSVTVE